MTSLSLSLILKTERDQRAPHTQKCDGLPVKEKLKSKYKLLCGDSVISPTVEPQHGEAVHTVCCSC